MSTAIYAETMVFFDYMKSNTAERIIIAICILVAFFGIQRIEIPSTPIVGVPSISQTIDFHTPVLESGYALPLHITTNTTIGPDQGIILINNLVIVEKTASLTILPGTTLAVREYGGISVYGTLNATGTTQNPIRFITNERNETNRHWVGILLQNSSTSQLRNVSIHHASPAISCSPQAKTNIQHISILLDAVGNERNTAQCTI